MARSVWKGPFVELSLLKKAEDRPGRRWHQADQDLVASLHDPAAVRWSDVQRLQRSQVHPRLGFNEEMVGHKLGEFAPTRTFPGHAADKKGKR